MVAVSQPAYFNIQEFTDLGALAAGGRLYTYEAGTTTFKAAYTESTGTTTHTYTADGSGLPDGQYIALNARGELPAPLYIADGAYDITYKTAAGATVWTRQTSFRDVGATSTRTITTGETLGSVDYSKTIVISSAVTSLITVTLPDAGTVENGYTTTVVNRSRVRHAIGRTTGTDTINGVAKNGVIAPGSTMRVTVNSTEDGYLAFYSTVTDVPIVTLEAFWPTLDGVADDTVPMQKYIDYLIANRIMRMRLPSVGAAKILITDSLNTAGRLHVEGDGEFGCTIWGEDFTSGQPIFNCVNDDADVVEGFIIENVTIRSNNGLATGVHVENLSHLEMRNVTLYNLYDGVEVTGDRTFSLSFSHIYGVSITNRTIRYYTFAGGGQHTFDECSFTGVDGVFIEDDVLMDSLTFKNCNWEQCTTTDLTVEGSVRGLTVLGGRSEGLNGTVSFNINPASGEIVKGYIHTGFFWSSDSGNAYPIGIGGDVEGFVIQGNHSVNIGFIAAVLLNGAGAAGVIQGNNFDDSPLVVSANRPGVRVLSNNNSSGAMAEYGGKNGTFTATGTGFASAPTATARYSVGDGSVVSLVLPQLSGTSNADTFTVTGMPTDARPAADRDMVGFALDNGGSFAPCLVRVKTTGVIEIYYTLAAANWTTSGTKTLYGSVLTYPLI